MSLPVAKMVRSEFRAIVRRVAVGRLRGEYLSPLSKRGQPTATRWQQCSIDCDAHDHASATVLNACS